MSQFIDMPVVWSPIPGPQTQSFVSSRRHQLGNCGCWWSFTRPPQTARPPCSTCLRTRGIYKASSGCVNTVFVHSLFVLIHLLGSRTAIPFAGGLFKELCPHRGGAVERFPSVLAFLLCHECGYCAFIPVSLEVEIQKSVYFTNIRGQWKFFCYLTLGQIILASSAFLSRDTELSFHTSWKDCR